MDDFDIFWDDLLHLFYIISMLLVLDSEDETIRMDVESILKKRIELASFQSMKVS